MIQIRPVNLDEDYAMLVEWWKFWKWTPPTKGWLPEDGFISYEGDTPICAGWLIKTNTDIAWSEFIVSNPKALKPVRGEGIEVVIKAIIECAKLHGFKHMWTSVVHENLIKRYEKYGFKVAGSSANLVRNI